MKMTNSFHCSVLAASTILFGLPSLLYGDDDVFYSLQTKSAETTRVKYGFKNRYPQCVRCPSVPRYYRLWREQVDAEWNSCDKAGTLERLTFTRHTEHTSELIYVWGRFSESGTGWSCTGTLSYNGWQCEYIIDGEPPEHLTTRCPCTWEPRYPGDPRASCFGPFLEADMQLICGDAFWMETRVLTGEDCDPSGEMRSTITLSDEYSTAELLSPAGFAYPDDWTDASSAEAATEINPENDRATIRKSRFRFKVKAPAGQRFEIAYYVHYQCEAKGIYRVETNALQGVGTWRHCILSTGRLGINTAL